MEGWALVGEPTGNEMEQYFARIEKRLSDNMKLHSATLSEQILDTERKICKALEQDRKSEREIQLETLLNIAREENAILKEKIESLQKEVQRYHVDSVRKLNENLRRHNPVPFFATPLAITNPKGDINSLDT